jgi:hypothetical protein
MIKGRTKKREFFLRFEKERRVNRKKKNGMEKYDRWEFGGRYLRLVPRIAKVYLDRIAESNTRELIGERLRKG